MGEAKSKLSINAIDLGTVLDLGQGFSPLAPLSAFQDICGNEEQGHLVFSPGYEL